MTTYVVILEDRHIDVVVEVYMDKAIAVERAEEIAAGYDTDDVEQCDCPKDWLYNKLLSEEGDAIRVEQIETNTRRDV